MNSHLRLLRFLPILIALCLLMPARPASADVAPPPPPAGVDILPGQELTQVRMVSEQVLIDIQQNGYDKNTRAQVTATFQMQNLGDKEERMQVRFPLNVLFPEYQSDINTCVYPMVAPEISDFQAWVDGKQAPVTNELQRIKDEFRGLPEKNVKCWANFPVTFPPGKEVRIEVRYSVEGYAAYDAPGVIEFPYVLITGRDWKDTIGRAEITFRAPFELTSQTLFDYYPEEREGGPVTISGREARWLYENFEPETNPSVTIMNPGIWQRILREQEAIKKNPKDGEAWGRLGRWYKEAIRLRRGFRWDEGGLEMYKLSREAYGKSVALLPKDADWHAGYADLLCWNMQYDQLGSKVEARDDTVACFNEIRTALSINPRQALALELLDEMKYYQPYPPGDPMLRVEGSRVDYLILTTTPTARPEDIATPEPTQAAPTQAAPTEAAPATAAPTATPPAEAGPTDAPGSAPVGRRAQVDITETASAVNTAAAVPTDILPTEAAPEKGRGGGGLCGAAFLPLAAALVVWMLRRKAGV